MRIVVDYLAEGEGYCSDRKIKHKAALIKMIKVLSGEADIEDIGEWLKEQGIRPALSVHRNLPYQDTDMPNKTPY